MNLGDAIAEIDQLRARIAGLEDQHHRDSAELRRLSQTRDEQRDGRLAALEKLAVSEARIAELEAQRVPDDIEELCANLEYHGTPWRHMQNNKAPIKSAMRKAAELLRAAAPKPAPIPQGWDAQAYAAMRDEIEYWKKRATESDEALERIRNDLAPMHMGEPVMASRAQLGAVPSDMGNPISDVLSDALLNLEHDNYELSYSGSKNRQADIGLIRAALTATGGRDEVARLLEIANCPCCDGSGAHYDNLGEACQCQWCDERSKALAAAQPAQEKPE